MKNKRRLSEDEIDALAKAIAKLWKKYDGVIIIGNIEKKKEG